MADRSERADRPRVALVVPLVASLGELDVASYAGGLERLPWLDLLVTGRSRSRELFDGWTHRSPRARFVDLGDDVSDSQIVQEGMRRALSEGYPFAGYWGPDCEVPLAFLQEWVDRLAASELQLVFGSRLRLVQHDHPGLWLRHYAGRAWASAVSVLLKLEAYDTECCAKLFRNGPIARAAFEPPFETKVCFDTELFVRLLELEAGPAGLRVERDCLELPLRTWRRRPRPRYGLTNLHRVLADGALLHKRLAVLGRKWR